MRFVRAQSENRHSELSGREVKEGGYGEPERPPWQPADLLIKLDDSTRAWRW